MNPQLPTHNRLELEGGDIGKRHSSFATENSLDSTWALLYRIFWFLWPRNLSIIFSTGKYKIFTFKTLKKTQLFYSWYMLSFGCYSLFDQQNFLRW